MTTRLQAKKQKELDNQMFDMELELESNAFRASGMTPRSPPVSISTPFTSVEMPVFPTNVINTTTTDFGYLQPITTQNLSNVPPTTTTQSLYLHPNSPPPPPPSTSSAPYQSITLTTQPSTSNSQFQSILPTHIPFDICRYV